MKRKRKRKSPKKGRVRKAFFLLVIIGIVASLGFLFRQEISRLVKPFFEKASILEEKREVRLFFSDSEAEYLLGEKRGISKRAEVKEEAREAIAELIKGPKGKLTPTLPPRTKLLSLQISETGVAKVNFNQALSKDHPGGSSAEMMTVYSIVNSLTLNFPQIKKVQILIEGKPIESIAGHLSLRQPLPSKSDLIRRQ